MAREQSHAPGGVHRNAGVGLYTRCEWNRELVSGSGSSGRRLLVTRTSGMRRLRVRDPSCLIAFVTPVLKLTGVTNAIKQLGSRTRRRLMPDVRVTRRRRPEDPEPETNSRFHSHRVYNPTPALR